MHQTDTVCVCSEVCLCYYSYMPQMVISKEEEVDHHSCGIHVQRQIIISYLHTHTQSHTRHPIILRHITHKWVILWAYENCINTVPWSSIVYMSVCVCVHIECQEYGVHISVWLTVCVIMVCVCVCLMGYLWLCYMYTLCFMICHINLQCAHLNYFLPLQTLLPLNTATQLAHPTHLLCSASVI